MKSINYKSDFDFLLRLKDSQGQEIFWPDYNWSAKFWTSSKVNAFIASCKDGVMTNCYNDNEVIHVVANNHKLGCGILNVEFTAELPSSIYPDGDERVVTPMQLDIQLVRGVATPPTSAEVDLALSYVQPYVDLSTIKTDIRDLQGSTTIGGTISLITNYGRTVLTLPIIKGYTPPASYGYGYASGSGYFYDGYDDYISGIGEWDI